MATRSRLSTTELLPLLAELFGSRRAGALLETHGDLRRAYRASDEELKVLGFSSAQIRRLRAIVHLAAYTRPSPFPSGRSIRRGRDVAAHFSARLALAEVEEFWALALDVRNRVLEELFLGRGSLTRVEVHPRDVFRPLVRLGAAAVIFVHNHPSGDPAPSEQDHELTHRLVSAGLLLGIPVLDHLVVTPGGAHTSLVCSPPRFKPDGLSPQNEALRKATLSVLDDQFGPRAW